MPSVHPRIRAILFDLDGTLTDSRPGILTSYAYALTTLGRTLPTGDLGWCIGPPIRECFARLLETDDAALIEESYARYREQYERAGKYENRVYAGVPEMLTVLRAGGYRLFLATAKATPLAASILEHFGLRTYFAGVYGAEPDGARAEKADLVRYILQTERVAADETILIGDQPYDVIGAHANGVLAGAVTYGYGKRDDLLRLRPVEVFDSPEDIARYFAA